MLQHMHPDDTARTFDVLETVIKDAAPFSCYHRIIDAQKRVRFVLSVGRGLVGPHGKVEQVTGFFVDLTEVRRSETQHEVELALIEIAKTRSVIEQAKGIVMVGAGCDADEAFAILRSPPLIKTSSSMSCPDASSSESATSRGRTTTTCESQTLWAFCQVLSSPVTATRGARRLVSNGPTR